MFFIQKLMQVHNTYVSVLEAYTLVLKNSGVKYFQYQHFHRGLTDI